MEKSTSNFQKNMVKLQKEQDNEYRKELDNVFERLSKKNKVGSSI